MTSAYQILNLQLEHLIFLTSLRFFDIVPLGYIAKNKDCALNWLGRIGKMSLSLRSMISGFMLPGTLRQIVLGTSISTSSTIQTGGFLSQLFPVALPSSISLQLPSLGSIWDSILKAVPKKKTSHRKRRQRLLAGKAMKDVTNLEKCPGCGSVKRTQRLCPFCVRGEGFQAQ